LRKKFEEEEKLRLENEELLKSKNQKMIEFIEKFISQKI